MVDERQNRSSIHVVVDYLSNNRFVHSIRKSALIECYVPLVWSILTSKGIEVDRAAILLVVLISHWRLTV